MKQGVKVVCIKKIGSAILPAAAVCLLGGVAWCINRYVEQNRRAVKPPRMDNTKVMDHIRVVHYLFQKSQEDGSPRFIRPYAIALDLNMDPAQVGRVLTGLVGDVDNVKTGKGYVLNETVNAIEKKMSNAGRVYMRQGIPVNLDDVGRYADANGNGIDSHANLPGQHESMPDGLATDNADDKTKIPAGDMPDISK